MPWSWWVGRRVLPDPTSMMAILWQVVNNRSLGKHLAVCNEGLCVRWNICLYDIKGLQYHASSYILIGLQISKLITYSYDKTFDRGCTEYAHLVESGGMTNDSILVFCSDCTGDISGMGRPDWSSTSRWSEGKVCDSGERVLTTIHFLYNLAKMYQFPSQWYNIWYTTYKLSGVKSYKYGYLL